MQPIKVKLNAMHVVCAWCSCTMQQGHADAPVSHSICTPCSERVRIQTSRLSRNSSDLATGKLGV